MVLLGGVRELEVQAERPQHSRLDVAGSSTRPDVRRVAVLPSEARSRERAPRWRGSLRLLLDEHAAEQRAEQADVSPQGRRAVSARFAHARIFAVPPLGAGELCFPVSCRSWPGRTPTMTSRSLSQWPWHPGLARRRRRRELHRWLVWSGLWLFALGNLAAILYITLFSSSGDALNYHWNSFDAALLGVGRLTAFLAGYFALIEVILLARVPFLERLVGFDRLTIWHRWNGHAVIYLALAHVICTVWGYAKQDGLNWFTEYWHWLTLPQPKAPGSFSAASGAPPPSLSINLGAPTTSPYPDHHRDDRTFLLFVVLAALARDRTAEALARVVVCDPLHRVRRDCARMVPHDPGRQRADRQRECGRLLARALLLRARDRDLVPACLAGDQHLPLRDTRDRGDPRGAGGGLAAFEGPRARPARDEGGPVLFLAVLHEGVLVHAAPVLAVGEASRRHVPDHGQEPGRPSAKFGEIPVGTRVFAEGPFGVFTDESRTEEKALLIAGGIGITPVRALLEDMDGDVIALYRVVSADDLVFADELDEISRARGAVVNYVVGDHASAEGRDLLSPAHLRELVPDIAERDVFICGPVGMIDSIVPNLRRANVTRHHLHVERFAL